MLNTYSATAICASQNRGLLRAILSQAIQDGHCVDCCNTVIDLFPVSPAVNDPSPAHLIQVLRNRTLLTAHCLDDLGDHALVMEIQMLQYLQALRMANNLDDFCHADKKTDR